MVIRMMSQLDRDEVILKVSAICDNSVANGPKKNTNTKKTGQNLNQGNVSINITTPEI